MAIDVPRASPVSPYLLQHKQLRWISRAYEAA